MQRRPRVFDSVSGSFNTKLNALAQRYSDVYSEVGHYLNIINEDYEYMGASYVAQAPVRRRRSGVLLLRKEFEDLHGRGVHQTLQRVPRDPGDQEPDTPTEPEKPQQYSVSITADSYGKASLRPRRPLPARP